ncbi:MAG: FAD-binding oxidoreductase, partial [Chloroflexi bacterium]|nr:FAD-binding oxidoreductase [Chloroflexota bacterium]
VAAAARAGVELHDGVEARRLGRAASGWEVITAGAGVRAAQVMIATNGYTGALHPPLRRRVIPLGSYIIVTEPLPPALAGEVSPRGRMMYDTKHFLYYFRLTPDNRMMFGGRASFVPSTPESDRSSARILRQGMLQVYPQLADVAVAQVWGGTLGFTRDLMPHAGEMDGVYYDLGYGGHGVAMATYLGKCMAQVMDGHPEANPFRGIDFPAVPLYNGWPWFLPLAWVAHRVLDWLT